MKHVPEQERVNIRPPSIEDANAVWHLVKHIGTLDPNSSYLYLLLFRYFADTCLVAEKDGQIVGFVTSFVQPDDPSALFVWQIGVTSEERGQGIATRLLQSLLELPAVRKASRLEATVSPGNRASHRLFETAAQSRNTVCETVEGGFPASLFPEAGHEDEPLIRITLGSRNINRIKGGGANDQ
ncbi:diaminobutyrate acetyltransferase [Paenibacillus sp. H1-7]|uniref:diaminobutyrate acetyltransferase n=1 Tax=Paenibacillus sp. H1-7 TaxID=2282849 RepID=UPI001EF80CE7|nr:diaminobutyrate acetyltransferase [Paenibacillus sp. H1-7]ULL16822.1 diaminobutyrate acetyltransferase [Paenibacillus sp. H1-7]